jgi:glycosyltransferase involved in cell wall biosynthesis
MRIAFVVINANRREGTSRAVVEVAERLGKKYEVVVYSRTAENVDTSSIRWQQIHAPSWPDVAEFDGFRLLTEPQLRRESFDIIHSAGCNVRYADVYAIQTVHPAKMAATQSLARNERIGALRRFTRNLYDRRVVAEEKRCYRTRNERGIIGYLPVSLGTMDELRGHYDLVDCPIEIIPNAADTDLFHPRLRETARVPLRRELNCDDSQVVFLFAGGEWRRKGLDLALMSLAHAHSMNSILVIAGADPQAGEFRELARRLGIEDRVRWLGFRNDIARLYAAADVFLFPSAYEAFSLATIEAASTGLPVVMCDISGAHELLGDGTGGTIVNRDPRDLSKVIDDYALSEELRLRRGIEARVKVEREFTWDLIARKTECFYQKLLALRESAGR